MTTSQIRKTQRVSLFPVGSLSELPVSTPLLHKNGTLLDFYEGWVGHRRFSVDMAGFAVSIKHFVKASGLIVAIFINDKLDTVRF